LRLSSAEAKAKEPTWHVNDSEFEEQQLPRRQGNPLLALDPFIRRGVFKSRGRLLSTTISVIYKQERSVYFMQFAIRIKEFSHLGSLFSFRALH
jgi:hypothetical protein